MKKLIAIFLMMSLFSVSCNKSDRGSSSKQDAQGVPVIGDHENNIVPGPPIPTPTNSNLPALALSFDTNITLVSFTAAQEEKYNKAIEIVKLVVATEKFKNDVVNFTYNGQKAFIDNKSRTNQQIYQTILDAAGNLFHEWLHKLGYTHSSSSTPTRPYSVPYAVGYMMGNIGKNFL